MPHVPRRARPNFDDALTRLARAEDAFLGQQFLAPVLRGRGVRVRIAGVVCALAVEPADFEGWGVFRPTSHTRARLERNASMAERRRYLDLLPAVRLIICERDERSMLAIPMDRADPRLQFDGLIDVSLLDDGAATFDPVIARFDGAHCWFDQVDPQADAGAAEYLRRAMIAQTKPAEIARPGLLGAQRTAYAIAYEAMLERRRRAEQASTEGRLGAALRHAGASLSGYSEIRDGYRVTFELDGRPHTSVVRKADLTLLSAGICLSGQDANFDLASLVGVLREGARRR